MKRSLSTKIGLIALVVLASNALWSLPSSVIAQTGQYCRPQFIVKPTAGQAGSTLIKIKPENAKNVVAEIIFENTQFGSSIRSDCPGYARVLYVWKNTQDSVPINTNYTFKPFSGPLNDGYHQMELQLSLSRNFGDPDVYQKLSATVEVGGGTVADNTNTKSNSNAMANANIGGGVAPDTSVSASFIDPDQVIGTFWNPLTVESVPQLIASLIRILFILTGLVAVIVIIIAGFRMVVDNGNETQVKKAKEAITWAVVGLIVSILAFSIVAIIQRIIQS